jgi:anaerobic glycerol-3-phosphate dehydrogenase
MRMALVRRAVPAVALRLSQVLMPALARTQLGPPKLVSVLARRLLGLPMAPVSALALRVSEAPRRSRVQQGAAELWRPVAVLREGPGELGAPWVSRLSKSVC